MYLPIEDGLEAVLLPVVGAITSDFLGNSSVPFRHHQPRKVRIIGCAMSVRNTAGLDKVLEK